MKKLLVSLVTVASLFMGTMFADEITLMNYAQPQEKAILDLIASLKA